MKGKNRLLGRISEVKRENKLSHIRKTDVSQSASSSVDHIMFLQRSIGNNAVKNMFQSIKGSGEPRSESIRDLFDCEFPIGDTYDIDQLVEGIPDQFTPGANIAPTTATAGMVSGNLIQREKGEGSDEDKPWWQEAALMVAENVLPGGIGEAIGATSDIGEGITTGSALSWAKGINGILGTSAAMGGFELLGSASEGGGLISALGTLGSEGLGAISTVGALPGAAGMEATAALGLTEATGASAAGAASLGTMGALGPIAAVAGAGLAGVGAGIGLDKLSNYVGQKITGNEGGDYSISGGLASGMSWLDEKATGGLRSLGVLDESKPAYTQTLGWKLADLFD